MKRILLVFLFALAFIVVAVVGLIAYNLNRGVREYETISYSALPTAVSARFKQVSDSLMTNNAFRCVHTNLACDCNMQSYNRFPFPSAYLSIETCDEKVEIDFSVSTLRYFVIDGSDVYFIVLNSFSYNDQTTFSSVVNVETARYGRIKM